MAEVNERLHAVDPRRRVDRKKFPDPDMPEFPGAVFLHHLGWKTAQAGAWVGCGVLAPLYWMRGTAKGPLFTQIMPRYGGPLMAAGYVGGIAYGYMTVVANKGPDAKRGFSPAEMNQRALQIVKNEKLQTKNDFVIAGIGGALLASLRLRALPGTAALGASAGYLAYLVHSEGLPVLREDYWDPVKRQIPSSYAEIPKLGVAGTALQPPSLFTLCMVLPSVGLFFMLRGARRVPGTGRKISRRQ